ncbi:MAG: YicC/YloC family endoribonuclease [Pirellulaceae bacterium]|nr:YicC/YloC family endoribonuclease [Pirellulaceae bacterium]
MLLSMTGHGEAQRHAEGTSVAVEVRTVNNRYLKVSFRATEGYQSLEPQIEAVVRQQIRRGTLQVNLRVDREPTADDYRLNEAVLRGYLAQLGPLLAGNAADSVPLASLLALPGVVREPTAGADQLEAQWPLIEKTLSDALRGLSRMRTDEGRAMTADLAANSQVIAAELAAIERRGPLVVDAYRGRLQERLNKLLGELGVRIEPADIVREVGIFAERSDIAEEIVRLKSHLEQFDATMAQEESNGRKLEFLTQEMFRETNTIGSKANDAEIARHVIEIKSAIERMREMIQNVE